jgi:hypothetical protein
VCCVQLPFCQLTGRYRLRLPYWNTYDLPPPWPWPLHPAVHLPYAHVVLFVACFSRTLGTNAFNNCPRGNPPDWNKPIGC